LNRRCLPGTVPEDTVWPVIVGLLSDTHGHVKRTARAVKLLLDHGAECLVHCGDVGGTDVLDCLAGHPATFVFGNNDLDRTELARYAVHLGITCGGTIGLLSFGNKSGVVTHGDDGAIIRKVLKDQAADYLFVGHTHEPSDHRQGRVRVINPGALHRAAERTAAVLDTEADRLEFLVVPRAAAEG
jgi:putative phosphoesterase